MTEQYARVYYLDLFAHDRQPAKGVSSAFSTKFDSFGQGQTLQ